MVYWKVILISWNWHATRQMIEIGHVALNFLTVLLFFLYTGKE
jgi:hypothetical protein